MTLLEKIISDLRKSISEENTETKSLLRVIIGEADRQGKNIGDQEMISIIKKMIDNAAAVNNENEIKILERYLPKQLSEVELKNIIINLISANSYTIKDMGNIMGYLKKEFTGQYDGKIASDITKKILRP